MVREFVIDSSILIEFSKHGILEELFSLPFGFVVPDLLFEQELIDLGQYSRDDLLRFGLGVETLGPAEVSTAQSHQSSQRRLSFVDCSGIALASARGYALLTGDRRMQNFAESLGIEFHEVLWLIDRIHAEQILTLPATLKVLMAMRDSGRSSVPETRLEQRIQELSAQASNRC